MSADSQPARVTFRPPEELLVLLNEAAERSDRSLSAEINARLERTFRQEKEKDQVQDMLFEVHTRLSSIERAAEHIKEDVIWAMSRNNSITRYNGDGVPLPKTEK